MFQMHHVFTIDAGFLVKCFLVNPSNKLQTPNCFRLRLANSFIIALSSLEPSEPRVSVSSDSQSPDKPVAGQGFRESGV